jgi:hypothetical protein
MMASMATFFADHFEIDPDLLEKHGAFNVSLVTDLPVFIDPFLLSIAQSLNTKSFIH